MLPCPKASLLQLHISYSLVVALLQDRQASFILDLAVGDDDDDNGDDDNEVSHIGFDQNVCKGKLCCSS